MAIDFVPDEKPKEKSNELKIDFVPHETVGGHLRSMIDKVANARPETAAQRTAINAANALWETAPYVVAGEAMGLANAPRFVSAAAENLPKAAKYLTNLAGVAGKNALFGAGAGAAQSAMEGDFKGAPQNALQGAGIGAVLGPATNLVGDAVNALRPSNFLKIFKGKTSPEEAKVAAEMAGDLPVGLGQILDSSKLNKIEKTLGVIPFSGAAAKADKIKDATGMQTEKLLSLMRGNQSEEEIAANLHKGIVDANKMHKAKAKELYDAFLNSAKENNVTILDTPETQKIAKQYLDEHLQNATPLDKKMVKTLQDLTKKRTQESALVDASGKKISKDEPINIDEMHNRIKSLKKLARTIEKKDPYLSDIYNDLSGTMRKDLHNAAIASGSPDVTANLSVADKYYKENVVPYKQTDVKNLINEKSNQENIGNFLTQSKKHIDKIVSDLPDSLKKSAAYLKFKSAIKENPQGKYSSEPKKLFDAYNNLSVAQKDKLFSKSEQKEFQRLGKLAEFNKNSKLKEKHGINASHALSALGLGVPAYELLVHGDPEQAAKMGVYSLALGGLARGGLNALTSPGVRNALVNGGGNALRGMMSGGIQGGLIGNAVQPQQPQTIDFQMSPANSLNNIDADLINNQIMESQ